MQKRREALEADPLIEDTTPERVKCRPCGAWIRLNGASYHPTNWDLHRKQHPQALLSTSCDRSKSTEASMATALTTPEHASLTEPRLEFDPVAQVIVRSPTRGHVNQEDTNLQWLGSFLVAQYVDPDTSSAISSHNASSARDFEWMQNPHHLPAITTDTSSEVTAANQTGIPFPTETEQQHFLISNSWWSFIGGSTPIRSAIPNPLENAWSTFLAHVARTHSPTSACHAATEVFTIDGNILTFIATLREDLDSYPNFWTKRDVKTDFDVQVIKVDAQCNEQNPTSWLHYQASAGAVQRLRMKSALWTFGALPVHSHISDSSSFRWLRQAWRYQVQESIDKEYETVKIGLSLSVTLLHRLREMVPSDRQTLLRANMEYMSQTMSMDVLAFNQASLAGHANCPHVRMLFDCPYQDATFDLALKSMEALLLKLENSQTDSVWAEATRSQRQVARDIGGLLYKFRHAYGLLAEEEYERYHRITYGALLSLRATLSSLPVGVVWNYLAPVDKDEAVRHRLEHPLL
ncbi:hypothetical protein B0H11DRAFT_2241051 [Mycena galericulata]|nr:hypothetical protein B0H11DRAFT_2241051 [Mycena galericulata]